MYSAQFEENQVSTSTSIQQNVFTVQQIQPQDIFAGAHIDKFEGYTFNITVFCNDQLKIYPASTGPSIFLDKSRKIEGPLLAGYWRSQGWMRTDRWAIEAQTGITYIAVALLVPFHKLLFQLQAFSLSLYEKFCLRSLTKFVQSCTLNSYFLALINRARGLYGRILTEVASTDRTHWGLYQRPRSRFSHTDRPSSVNKMFIIWPNKKAKEQKHK